jgi:general secretion pathway protein D
LALALALSAQGQTPPAAVSGRAPVTVNFVNADVEAVTRAFGAMINRQIAIDPRVKGNITVYSEQPQSVAEAYQSYLTALRGLGFAVVETGGLLKVVPEADAKLQTSTVSVGGEVPRRGDQIMTQIFTLRHENPNNLVAVLRPLISPNNTINASPGSSTLVITDYAENLQRLGKIVAALDQPNAAEIEVIPLRHLVASDVLQMVQRLADGGSGTTPVAAPGGAAAGGAVIVLADARTNSLIVRSANVARVAAVKAAVAKLDRPAADGGVPGAPGMYVVHLKNADAVRLATVLRAAFAATGGGGTTGGGMGATAPSTPSTPGRMTTAANTAPTDAGASAQSTAPVSGAAAPSTGGYIQADPATNSLIITAPEPLYRQLRAMIDQLDSRRAQVYIESMIVEVSGDNSADVGFEWLALGNKAVGLQSLSTGAAPNILSVNASMAADGTIAVGDGLNLGLLRTIDGVTSLSAILRLLQSRSQTNIVSTPNIITLDNEEAKIVVGENVPFITGQFTNTAATTNAFQTIERKDVGITLRIKPQIGENGAIRMEIYQEQSAVKSTTAAGTSNAGPSTTKRSIENVVTVDDGQILVLGGLIEDTYTTTQSKVPLLGDIPYLGALFRSESRERRRTNLLVFLRPIVMRDADAQQRFSAERYDKIRERQIGEQPAPNVLLPVDRAPVMPPSAPGRPVPVAPFEPPPPASAPARPVEAP